MPERGRQVALQGSEWHRPNAHVLLARRITFDMRGADRLAGRRPLDGRVRHRFAQELDLCSLATPEDLLREQ